MADETPQSTSPQEESKKETVRINLPPGMGARPGGTPPATPPASATTRLKPVVPSGLPDEEAKKETAVMGTPVTAPKPKKDTSRVQVTTAKPGPPEAPRPVMKFKTEESTPPPSPLAVSRPPAPGSGAAAAPSGVDTGLSIGAIILSVAVLAYLAFVAFGSPK